MNSLFQVFPNEPISPEVDYLDGMNIQTSDGRTILDMTAGGTHYAILGGNNERVKEAIKRQVDKFCHVDYKLWTDGNLERLSSLLLTRKKHNLSRIYFSGNSGAEANEAAMKISYQSHHDNGFHDKKWFISRKQSYHGSTSDALAIGDRPNLDFYRPMLSPFRRHIDMHHPSKLMRADETIEQYGVRSAKELEDVILEIGPERVCGFIGETIMGGLVGDVPPAPNYWKEIRRICSKYNVHLIMDEVYCGTGSSGKIYCCDYDEVTPDFITIGKTLAAGYGVLSAVITSEDIYRSIKRGQGRLQHTTTFQGHSLSVAAALAVQNVVHDDDLLANVNQMGEYIRKCVHEEFGENPFFKEIRGRGLRLSIEYNCANQNDFGVNLTKNMLEKHSILTSAKWHRISITPALIVTKSTIDKYILALAKEFKKLSNEKKYQLDV